MSVSFVEGNTETERQGESEDRGEEGSCLLLPLFLSPFLNRRCKWARDDYCKGGGGYRECGEGNVCSVLFCPVCLTPSLLRGIWLLPHLLQLHHPHPFRVKKEVDLVCLPESAHRRKQKQRRTLPKHFRLVPEKKLKERNRTRSAFPPPFASTANKVRLETGCRRRRKRTPLPPSFCLLSQLKTRFTC